MLTHKNVPEHIIITDNDELEKIRKQFNIVNNSNYPEISRFDPVAIAIGLRPDQLCKIRRSSPTAITYEYYRLCSN